MVLLPAASTSEQLKSFVAHVTKLVEARKGTIDSNESLGKRQLAYEIKKQREAFYLLFTVSLDASVAQSFERDIRLSESVLRSLFILKEEDAPEALESATLQTEEQKEE